jgi:hypothetical protein
MRIDPSLIKARSLAASLQGVSPEMADFVAKVENRATLKTSQKLILRPLCRCNTL